MPLRDILNERKIRLKGHHKAPFSLYLSKFSWAACPQTDPTRLGCAPMVLVFSALRNLPNLQLWNRPWQLT